MFALAANTRRRIMYTLGSALLVWHALAMVVGPAPESTITDAARTVLQPYLTTLRLDNVWGFFAPNVNTGQLFRYVVEDSSGEDHTFTPADELNRFHPDSIWQKDRFKSVMNEPSVYGDATAADLCKDHAALNPVSITLEEATQKSFWPGDTLDGKSPFDPEFLDVRVLRTIQCPTK